MTLFPSEAAVEHHQRAIHPKFRRGPLALTTTLAFQEKLTVWASSARTPCPRGVSPRPSSCGPFRNGACGRIPSFMNGPRAPSRRVMPARSITTIDATSATSCAKSRRAIHRRIGPELFRPALDRRCPGEPAFLFLRRLPVAVLPGFGPTCWTTPATKCWAGRGFGKWNKPGVLGLSAPSPDARPAHVARACRADPQWRLDSHYEGLRRRGRS